MSNTFGSYVTVTTFGESHGPAMGVVMDGLPAGLNIKADDIQADLDKRRPGRSEFTSSRNEPDKVEIISGLSASGTTNGAPLTMLIRNQDGRSQDYQPDIFRPGHADWPYYMKYNLPPQPGGGRASGRETVSRVAAGAVARKILAALGIQVRACSLAIGSLTAENIDPDFALSHALRFADPDLAPEAEKMVRLAKEKGDSLGGVVLVEALNVPFGWGEPVFAKLEAVLGGAYFSIGAVRGVEFGQAREICRLPASLTNDPLGPQGPLSNNHGGILGGLSSGLPIIAKLLVKPTPSIASPQNTVDLHGVPRIINIRGRHDPCLLPRLAPVAEAMTLLTLLDAAMAHYACSSLASLINT
ncbi:MAG: chorismate synthase [Desulfarculales bacterium]|jgi:chorismate synthase|nr:chorismate synthase [Desulfarculales bacterium]